MSPQYLYQLADMADPLQLWKMGAFARHELGAEQRFQLDTGIALRRHASYIEELERCLLEKRSLLVTPLSSNGTAVRKVDTPEDHAKMRDRDRMPS